MSIVLMSTRVEDIDPIVPIWRILFVLLLIPTLLFVAIYLWKHRKLHFLSFLIFRIYDPSLEMYLLPAFLICRIKEEDVEKLQLLKKVSAVASKPIQSDLELETTNTIQCQRCGFVNSEKSTVCRECNALLKGNLFFKSYIQKRYY